VTADDLLTNHDLLTIPEAARVTRISERTLRAWCRAGILKATQPAGFAGSWYTTPAALADVGLRPHVADDADDAEAPHPPPKRDKVPA
jgi:hypothetical protein